MRYGLIVFGIPVMFFVGLVLSILDITVCKNLQYKTTGVLLAKTYTPSKYSTVLTVNGGGSVGIGTVYTPTDLKFIVRYSGKIEEVELNDVNTFYKYKEGSNVKVEVFKGRIIGFKSVEIK